MRLVALGGTIITLFIFFSFLISRFSATNMAMLYGDLDMSDSAQLVTKLDGLEVPYTIKGNGTQIFVPSDQIDRMRMMMAKEGIPQGGSVGYEIFDRSESLGTSNFVQNINHVRALEGELSRTIASLNNVRKSRVHLVFGKRELFSRDKQEPSASIVLNMQGGTRLSRPEVLSIQHLVAAAVPGLKPTQISIIDDRGTLLARGVGDESDASYALANSEEMRSNFENKMRNSLEDMLERTLGQGNVRVEVRAELDFDRVTLSEETYDPESKVARSTQTSEETGDSVESEDSGAVTVQNDIPNAGAGGDSGSKNRNQTSNTSETINYEISRILKNTTREIGNIRKLSVAVLVDGTYETGENGESNYKPRDQEQLTKIDNLVKSAVGFDSKRGDAIEITNMQFARAENLDIGEDNSVLFGFSKQEILRIAETLGLAFIGFLVLLLVIRPLLSRIFESIPKAAPVQQSLPGSEVEALALSAPGGVNTQSLSHSGEAADDEDNELEQMINLEQVSGKVKASVVKRVTSIIDSHPEEAVSVVRGWLHEQK
jgi:flagellar M-ring protein FliF